MRLLPLLSVCLTLTACAGGAVQTSVPEYQIPPHLAARPAETLPPPEANNATALVTNHIETAGAYHRLREQYTQLLDWLATKRITARNE